MKNKKGIISEIIIIFIFIILLITSIFLSAKVRINYDLTKYLDKDSDTSRALEITTTEFSKNTSILVMAKNVDDELALKISDTLSSVDGVMFVSFDINDSNCYLNNNALYTLLVYGDDYSVDAQNTNSFVKDKLKEIYPNISFAFGGEVEVYTNIKDSIISEMVWILAIAVSIIIIIMMFTLKSWIEPFILLISCAFAIFINRGSNLIFGEISYVINAIAPILQLALSIDYSIVLINKYHEKKDEEDNKYIAMKKSILEVVRPVSASAFTTIAGLLALLFMSFKIGFDIGIVLMKGIVVSLITSLTLLPALILIFDKLIKKTQKKTINLNGNLFSKIAFRFNKIIAIVAIIIIIPCGFLAHQNVYTFNEKPKGEIYDTFGSKQTVMILYQNTNNNYEKELEFENTINQYLYKDGTNPLYKVLSYSNTIEKEYTYQEVSSSFGIEENDAHLLFLAYHLENGGGLSDPIKAIDLINYLYNSKENEESIIYPNLTPESKEQIDKLYNDINNYARLLKSDNYSRIILSLSIEKESKKTRDYVKWLQGQSRIEFGNNTYTAGEICSIYDVQTAFEFDNILITTFTIISIFIIVMIIFRSLSFPLVLVAIVQGAIWIDFTLSLIDAKSGIFFISYLIATCILMGSTIDYGILLSSEYVRIHKNQKKEEAVTTAIKSTLPTLFTSGLIMIVCGFVISIISTQNMIASVGLLIGKGTTLAIILVIIVLPSILFSTDKILMKLTINKKSSTS